MPCALNRFALYFYLFIFIFTGIKFSLNFRKQLTFKLRKRAAKYIFSESLKYNVMLNVGKIKMQQKCVMCQ